VTWDEAHFGRFGLMYLNQTFIHDVHPPLGKMVIAVCEHLTGFDAQGFDFASGAEYPGGGYTMLRALIAVFGIVTPHWAYLTMRRRGRTEAILAMWFVIFENALCLMSRLVVLDGMLVCLTAMS
ncbi:glycosyl transferase, partial [Coemansia spiralis]